VFARVISWWRGGFSMFRRPVEELLVTRLPPVAADGATDVLMFRRPVGELLYRGSPPQPRTMSLTLLDSKAIVQ
jgi:hypothetical protein